MTHHFGSFAIKTSLKNRGKSKLKITLGSFLIPANLGPDSRFIVEANIKALISELNSSWVKKLSVQASRSSYLTSRQISFSYIPDIVLTLLLKIDLINHKFTPIKLISIIKIFILYELFFLNRIEPTNWMWNPQSPMVSVVVFLHLFLKTLLK